MCVLCICVWLYTYKCNVCSGQKKLLDPLVLQLKLFFFLKCSKIDLVTVAWFYNNSEDSETAWFLKTEDFKAWDCRILWCGFQAPNQCLMTQLKKKSLHREDYCGKKSSTLESSSYLKLGDQCKVLSWSGSLSQSKSYLFLGSLVLHTFPSNFSSGSRRTCISGLLSYQDFIFP